MNTLSPRTGLTASTPVRLKSIAVVLASLASIALLVNPKALRAAILRSGQSVPIIVSTPATDYTGPQTTTASVTVISVPSGGSYVQVGCDHPSLVTSPSGSWPYNLQYPDGGSTTQSCNITLSAVSQNTTVILYACKSGVDASNPVNWSATRTITLHP